MKKLIISSLFIFLFSQNVSSQVTTYFPQFRLQFSYNNGLNIGGGLYFGTASGFSLTNSINTSIGVQIGYNFSHTTPYSVFDINIRLFNISTIGLETTMWYQSSSPILSITPKLAFSFVDSLDIGGGYTFLLIDKNNKYSNNSIFLYINCTYPSSLFLYYSHME